MSSLKVYLIVLIYIFAFLALAEAQFGLYGGGYRPWRRYHRFHPLRPRFGYGYGGYYPYYG